MQNDIDTTWSGPSTCFGMNCYFKTIGDCKSCPYNPFTIFAGCLLRLDFYQNWEAETGATFGKIDFTLQKNFNNVSTKEPTTKSPRSLKLNKSFIFKHEKKIILLFF